ncbi:MAG TPA: family 10 glycosylhydrolase [Longimicrobiales bacterium]|nr:family 10 glycosylhydrolase [Longimicrobiales bacterium]
MIVLARRILARRRSSGRAPRALHIIAGTVLCAVAACQPRMGTPPAPAPRPATSDASPETRMPRDTIHIDQLRRAALDGSHAEPVGTSIDDIGGATARMDAIREAGYRESSTPVVLPDVAREFRGVWVATVHNMDWPSSRNLTTAEAQQELIAILDAAHDLGLNAVIFQVRPAADALYASDIEPWADYLTGEQGRAPDPYWDPLAFAVTEAHARGLELHAWFNPFRAGFVAKKAPPAATHVIRRRPDLIRRYGTHYWMDPAEPDARQQALDVISDVVRRYDIDAVHLDDYFYPYQERDARGRLIQFPDDGTWRRYGVQTGMTRADWRRANIDAFVEQLYEAVHRIKPHVRVGISPFGIWRPGHPESVRGLDSYTELYADSRKWLANGWADYYAPQLYWRTHAPQQDYATLLQWWSDQNDHGRHIWAGNIPNNISGGSRGWDASEILEQISLTREQPGASGNIHFSASSLLRNPDGLGDAFRERIYAEPALVPASPWLSPGRLLPPVVSLRQDPARGRTAVELEPLPAATTWIVRARSGSQWRTQLVPAGTHEIHVEWVDGWPADAIAVSAVDRAGVEGVAAVFERITAQ